MYYGNLSVTISQENAPGTWLVYNGVWHVSQNPSGVKPQLLDSTSNSLHASTSVDFDGTDDHELWLSRLAGDAGSEVCPAGSFCYFNGVIDEVRIAATALSAGWITTEYTNIVDPSNFYSVVNYN